MSHKNSKLFDSYLRNEIEKVSFQYNPAQWADLGNRLDNYAESQKKLTKRKKGNTRISMYVVLLIIIAAILFFSIRFGELFHAESPEVKKPEFNKINPVMESEDKSLYIPDGQNNIGTNEESQEIYQKNVRKNILQLPIKKIHPDTIQQTEKNRHESKTSTQFNAENVTQTDSLQLIQNKEKLLQDSIDIKKKKKKFIIWD
jgi:hypothetical protein